MKRYLDLVPISAKIHGKQSRMSVFCIVLAVFLVTTIFGMADMFIRSQILQAQQESGNWHIVIKNISNEEAAIIDARPDIDVLSPYGVLNYRGDLGYTLGGKNVAICGSNENYITKIWDGGLAEGVFPQAHNEVLVTENVKQMMVVSIGDSIVVETPDGCKLTFTISGFLKNSANIMSNDFYGIFLKTEDYCAIYPNVVDGEPADYGIMFFVQFANTRNIQEKIANLKEQCSLSDEQVSSNNSLLGLLGQSRNPFLMSVYAAVAILFVLVLLAGIMMITSSLNSNVAQRTEFFGLMRCIGATPKQIMRLIRKEALLWCRLAIPIGIFSGVVVIWVLCAVLRFLGPEYFEAMPTFGLSIPSILAGIVVGLLTVLLAAYSPAKKAAKVSPLAAVSGNANTLKPARNAANTKLFKIDTALGIHHAKASRKNLLLMTSSFALSIILFLSFSVTVEFMQHTLTPLHPWTADLSIISPDNSCAIDKTFLEDLKENSIVDLVYGRMFAYEVPSVTNGIEKKVDLISYEQHQFDWAKDYLLEGSLESAQNDVGTGLIVYEQQNTIQIGDTVTLNISGQKKEIQIVGTLSDCPFYSAAGVGTIICSEDTFKQITGESKYTIIDVQLTKEATDEDVYAIHQMVDSTFTFSDERMGNSSTMGTYYCFWLFVYGFLVLIALITVFNIINSIAMSVSSRSKQYGAFRAIGLSTGQIRKMIVAEAFTYTIIGGIVGTILGLLSNKVLFEMLISYKWGDTWTIPLKELGIILLIVVLSAIVAVYGPIKRIHNMSIVDTISAQ
ncbi:MAG: ABC transporter permease [Coprococcus sp.]